MAFKFIIYIAYTCIVAASFNTKAAVISVDWKTAGDNLITQDTDSGLEWLDLTETLDLSYDDVTQQFSAGGQYEGWRYATGSEIVELWNNFGINLISDDGGATTVFGYADPNVITAAAMLGDTLIESNIDYHGVLGWAGEGITDRTQMQMGAYIASGNTFYYNYGAINPLIGSSEVWVGNYLVRESVVPIPAAVWLFGSGIIGLVGLARRKIA